MLYPDSNRRIKDISDLANLFKVKGHLQTSKEILSFVRIQHSKKIPSDFLKKLDQLFTICEGEFAATTTMGQTYRKMCFQEIKDIIFSAISRTYPKYGQHMLTIYPFVKRLRHGREITGTIADGMDPKKIKDKNLRAYLACFAHLIIVEGLFDELARILYFFVELTKGNTVSVSDLEKTNVWKIQRKIKPTPIFLRKWREKKYIRNAIGHAQFYFNPMTNTIRFVNIKEKTGKVTYDKTLSFSQFAELAMELEDSIEAFYYIILILRIYDLTLSKDAYK